MLKSILSVLGGTALGVFTIGLVQYLGHQMYPLPAQLNLNNPKEMESYLASAPVGALLLVIMAYALGSFLGGMLAARYAPNRPVLHALLAGALLLLIGVVNLWQIPHPLWFSVVSVLVYLPMASFGGQMSARRIP